VRKLHTQAVYKAILLAGCASSFAIAAPALAQADEEGVDCASDPDNAACDENNRIVVTGSRIARPELNSNSPMVNVDEEFLQQSSTAAVEQQLNKLPQFVVSQSSTAKNNDETGLLPAGVDIQPNATNTPGAATVSLRGVGANRTLVLIDGRRGTPSNAGGAVDVSTIPNAALERVEIISGGASATYGADAVAGVTNFILKRNFQGLELDGQMGFAQNGKGFEYQLGGIVGTDFPDGRGNVSMAMSMNTREFMLQKDNPFYRDLWANPQTTSGALFFVPRPGVTIQAQPTACAALAQGCVVTNAFPGANPAVPNNTTNLWFNEDGSMFIGNAGFVFNSYNARGGSAPFLKPWPDVDQGPYNTIWKATAAPSGDDSRIYAINAMTPQTIPTTRYNFLARGNYEINDWVGVFAQGMFSNSTTHTVGEPAGAQAGWDVWIPWGSGVYTGTVTPPGGFGTNYVNPTAIPAAVGGAANPAFIARYQNILPCATPGNAAYKPTGCTNTDVFSAVVPDQLEAILNNRTNPNASFALNGPLPNTREVFSDVTTYTLVAGLEGSIPGTDWTWEAFVNHGQSRTLSRQTGFYGLERMRAVFTSPNMGQNFSYTGNPQGFGFQAVTGRCTSGLDFFGGYVGITPDCREAIAAEVNNRGTTRQTIAEANIQGGLFDLPYGQLRFALGASYRENRYEFIQETLSTAGRSFLDQAAGQLASSNMENRGIDAKELYGELLVPLLADLPFIQELNLEVGGRMSHYDSTGTSYTFKILGDWQVTDWLRLRGGFNRAERAPNIAELLLTPQAAFRTDPIGDVCSTRHVNPGSANPLTNTTSALDVQAVCLELMARDNGGVYVPANDAGSYYGGDSTTQTQRQPTGAGGGFNYAIGNQYFRENINPDFPALEPEVADTWTAGAVIQSPFRSGPLSRLNLTVDYFNIKIDNPITSLSAGGQLLRCVNAQYNDAAAGVAAGATDINGDGVVNGADLNTAAIRSRAQAALQQGTCPSVFRTPTNPLAFQTGQADTGRILGSYVNEGLIKMSGIDATMSWSMDAGPGTVFLSLNGNYMFDFKIQSLDGQPIVDYVGTTGTTALGVNSGSSFEYRIFGNLGYSWGPASLSLQWQHIPKTEDGGEAQFLNGLAPRGTDNNGLPAYNLFNLNGSYELNEHVRLRFGVDNLFNKRPPLTGVDVDLDDNIPAGGSTQADGDGDGIIDAGALPGGGYSLFHDVQGRRFSLGANIRF